MTHWEILKLNTKFSPPNIIALKDAPTHGPTRVHVLFDSTSSKSHSFHRFVGHIISWTSDRKYLGKYELGSNGKSFFNLRLNHKNVF